MIKIPFKRSRILSDDRFIRIIKILKEQDKILAFYLVRLVIGFKLASARKYVDWSLDRFEKWKGVRHNRLFRNNPNLFKVNE